MGASQQARLQLSRHSSQRKDTDRDLSVVVELRELWSEGQLVALNQQTFAIVR